MGFNEAVLILEALVCAGCIFAVWRYDSERLIGVIATGLILIALTGHKVITVFGHETNSGNVLYAAVFLAIYLLIERRGRREGFRAMRWGIVATLGFVALFGISTMLLGSGETLNFDNGLYLIFRRVPLLASASLLSFAISQTLNIYLYGYLKQRLAGRSAWLRANICNIIVQALDSVLFFMIAFVGYVAPPHVLDIFVTGYLIKVLFMAAAAPILMLNSVEEDVEPGVASLLIRHDGFSRSLRRPQDAEATRSDLGK